MILQNYWGELAALATAACWTATSMAFESAGRRIGTFAVNLLRLGAAIVIFSVFLYFRRGMAFPVDASLHNWIWLGVSAIVGFVLGDLFLFKAFVSIGARISMLIMSLTPPIAAVTSWLILGETMTWMNILGMVVTLGGIAMVVLQKEPAPQEVADQKTKVYKYSLVGILMAFGGASGQAIGLVLSKLGMQDYDAFASSHIRVMVGFLGYLVLFAVFRKWHVLRPAIKNTKAMKALLIGTVFGPFLGVSMSLVSVKYTGAGIASTIMAIVPVLIIAPAVFIFHEKVTWKEIIGAVVSVGGVAIFFL